MKGPASVIIDESTSSGQISCLIIDLKCCIVDSTESQSIFLEILHLLDTTSDGFMDELMNCFSKTGFSKAFLQNY